jgi:hypothetical protein
MTEPFPLTRKEANMIEDYTPGRMTIEGEKHKRDLKIIGDRIVPQWWREEDHRLDVGDVEDILTAAPDVLVVGTGYAGNMRLKETLRARLQQKGIEIIVERTGDAVKTFNQLRLEGKYVAGAFHLTC